MNLILGVSCQRHTKFRKKFKALGLKDGPMPTILQMRHCGQQLSPIWMRTGLTAAFAD